MILADKRVKFLWTVVETDGIYQFILRLIYVASDESSWQISAE